MPEGFMPEGFMPGGFMPGGFMPGGFVPEGFKLGWHVGGCVLAEGGGVGAHVCSELELRHGSGERGRRGALVAALDATATVAP